MNHITTNKYRKTIGILAAACCAAVVFSSCGASEKKKDEEKEAIVKEDAPAATEAFLLHKGKLSSSLQMPGELIPFQQVDLYAKVNGFVKRLYADVGTEVKTGQLLAVMEAPELGSQLAGAESRVKTQEAIYTASKANYDRLLETSKTPGTVDNTTRDTLKD